MSSAPTDVPALRSIVLITLTALVGSMLMSSGVWTLDRDFPVLPIIYRTAFASRLGRRNPCCLGTHFAGNDPLASKALLSVVLLCRVVS
jgi:hypothetical protein